MLALRQRSFAYCIFPYGTISRFHHRKWDEELKVSSYPRLPFLFLIFFLAKWYPPKTMKIMGKRKTSNTHQTFRNTHIQRSVLNQEHFRIQPSSPCHFFVIWLLITGWAKNLKRKFPQSFKLQWNQINHDQSALPQTNKTQFCPFDSC